MNKQYFIEQIAKIAGIRISRATVHGNNVYSDLKRLCRSYKIKTFFDVGANTGQSVEELAPYYNPSDIHCFEPLKSTFLELKGNLASHKGSVQLNQMAVGSEKKSVVVVSPSPASPLAKISECPELPEHQTTDTEVHRSHSVEMTTLDEYCKKNGVENISFLKIDTEGYDLNVLKGTRLLFEQKRVDIFQVEVGMNILNETHESIQSFLDFANKYNYHPFGFYDQVHEWKVGKPFLRRSNMVFISPSWN